MQADVIADLRPAERLFHGALEIHAPNRAIATRGLDLYKVRPRLARIVVVCCSPMIDELTGQQPSLTHLTSWRAVMARVLPSDIPGLFAPLKATQRAP